MGGREEEKEGRREGRKECTGLFWRETTSLFFWRTRITASTPSYFYLVINQITLIFVKYTYVSNVIKSFKNNC